jgi:hypothetical protein
MCLTLFWDQFRSIMESLPKELNGAIRLLSCPVGCSAPIPIPEKSHWVHSMPGYGPQMSSQSLMIFPESIDNIVKNMFIT